MLLGRSATSDRNDRRQALPLLRGGKTRHSSLRPTPTKGEMAMIKEVHYLPRTPKCVNWLRNGVRPKEALWGHGSGRIGNSNSVNVPSHRAAIFSMLSQSLAWRRQYDEAKCRAGPVLDYLSAIGPPRGWVGEGGDIGEAVDR